MSKKDKKQEKNQEEKVEDIQTEQEVESADEAAKSEKVIDFAEQKAKHEESPEGKIESLQKEVDELKQTVQRTQADFINYKRRTEEEKSKITAFANETLLLQLIGMLDDFDRALDHKEDAGQSFVDGVMLIRKQLADLLEKNSVVEIATDGEFDPNFHYAVMQEAAEEPNKILEVFQKGYLLKDKVIRPAMVKVSN